MIKFEVLSDCITEKISVKKKHETNDGVYKFISTGYFRN